MCDVAYAALLQQFDADGRAVIASPGGSEYPPQFYREALDDLLTSDIEDSTPSVSAEVAELRQALGVA